MIITILLGLFPMNHITKTPTLKAADYLEFNTKSNRDVTEYNVLQMRDP